MDIECCHVIQLNSFTSTTKSYNILQEAKMSVHYKLKSNKMKTIISGSITTQNKSFMIM